MKHLRKLFFLLSYLSVLSGCLNNPLNVNEVKQTGSTPSSTVTLTSKPPLTITPNLPTLTSTPAATPTPPSIPTLALNNRSSGYQLTKPSSESLLELMDVLNTQYSYFSRFYDDEGNPMFDFMLDELSNQIAVIDAETKLYYPDGFANPQIVWSYYPFTDHNGYPVFPSVYLDSLTNAVFDDLNSHPEHLKDQGTIDGKGYTAKVYQVELDHDPQPEWLVRIDWGEIFALSWLVLDQKPDGNYTRLTQSLPDVPWIIPTSTVTIETLQDFTGDGLTDIISLDQGYMLGTDSYRFYIAKGTKDGFQQLHSINKSVSVTNVSADPAYTIQTPSGSKWLTLTISDPHTINWGCTWNTQTSYRWPNGIEQVAIMGKNIPQTPECSLAQAVKLYDSVDNPTAIRLLESAILHFNNRDEEQFEKSLFAHYRLAILYALSGKDSLSRQNLQSFIENLPEANEEMKESFRSLLGEPKINAILLCDKMYNAPTSAIPKFWEHYINATAAVHAYPRSNEIYPPALCPLQDVILDKIKRADLKMQPISEQALANQEVPSFSIQAYQFPNQDHPASFMLVGEKKLYVLGYVPTSDGWSWKILEEFDPTLDPPQTFFKDVTEDGYPELAYFQRYPYWACPEGKQGYKIFLTTASDPGFVSILHYVCAPVDTSFNVTDYLTDQGGDGVVDWVADSIRQSTGASSLSAERMGLPTWFTPDEIDSFFQQKAKPASEDDLIDGLYHASNISGVRQKLIAERTHLDPNDRYADRKWQRLTYLVAVSYEMEGQADKAIEAFASVLQSEDQTLWGNLAELHLK